MPARETRSCSPVDTGKLQPAVLGVTVPAGQPVQISLLAASQVGIKCSSGRLTGNKHSLRVGSNACVGPRSRVMGGAHAAQVSADVVLEFSLACSSAARAGDVSARERGSDDSVILWSGSVSGARRSSHCCAHLIRVLLADIFHTAPRHAAPAPKCSGTALSDDGTSAGVRLAVPAAGEALHSCALMLLAPGAYQIFGTSIRCHWGADSDGRGADSTLEAICLYPLHILVTS